MIWIPNPSLSVITIQPKYSKRSPWGPMSLSIPKMKGIHQFWPENNPWRGANPTLVASLNSSGRVWPRMIRVTTDGPTWNFLFKMEEKTFIPGVPRKSCKNSRSIMAALVSTSFTYISNLPGMKIVGIKSSHKYFLKSERWRLFTKIWVIIHNWISNTEFKVNTSTWLH